ncbi:hypothetical protein TMPK1_38810 [Rhodospirillales bacterium TMPK1]|uniref:Uncharacterized protein n=1 Tax=Roseiterribacter gracilis TaxID=2812848 RepID=A0A8S8XGG1_9PROT|nr:hypothetical protein TMPK1_38810 [Rhodospirillales bacterium TMPK1]
MCGLELGFEIQRGGRSGRRSLRDLCLGFAAEQASDSGDGTFNATWDQVREGEKGGDDCRRRKKPCFDRACLHASPNYCVGPAAARFLWRLLINSVFPRHVAGRR